MVATKERFFEALLFIGPKDQFSFYRVQEVGWDLLGLVREIWQNHYFSNFCSTNITVEQICLYFYSAILYSKDNGVLRNLKF
jgi:hypothetical protein